MSEKISHTIVQFLKYCISGGTGAIIDFVVFSVLIALFFTPYLIANAVSFSLGTVIVCYMQKNWTFRYKSIEQIHFYSKYLLSIGMIFLINTILLILGIEILHLVEINAKFLQVILSSIIGYIIQKNVVFR
jgi:putative flippase GtrA